MKYFDTPANVWPLYYVSRYYQSWFSPVLNRSTKLLQYGEGGLPVIVFPASLGKCSDWEDHGMLEALTPQVKRQELVLFCVDNVDREAWYDRDIPPESRLDRYRQFEAHIRHEVIPFAQKSTGVSKFYMAGCSLGAHAAFGFSLRYPEVTAGCVAMSGTYDIRVFLDDYVGPERKQLNAIELVDDLAPEIAQKLYSKIDFTFAVGDHDMLRAEANYMSECFEKLGIAHQYEVWPGGRHDWSLWKAMAQKYLGARTPIAPVGPSPQKSEQVAIAS